MKRDDKKIFSEKIFRNEKVEELINEKNYSDALVILLRNQKLDWPLLEKGYSQIQNVRTKSFNFDGYSIDAQHNPGRIKSSSADVTEEAVKNRECFLCVENLPVEQKGINYRDEYLILCNPYPVFFEHFTLTFNRHFPQIIEASFPAFLRLCKRLGKYYSVLYNGPECGASAPDHLHFQAVNKKFLKILNDSGNLINNYGEKIIDGRRKEVFGINDGLRKYFLIKSKDEHFIKNVFENLYTSFQKIVNTNNEPMMNILGNHDESKGWEIYVFLRNKHRPECFFKKGKQNLMLSPAVIDMAGTLILPREKDFEKLTADNIEVIFTEVVIGKEMFDYLKAHIKKIFQNVNYF